MSDHIRFTVTHHGEGGVSAYSRKTGNRFQADNTGDLWKQMREELGANRHWIRKSQWIVRTGAAVSGQSD